RLNIMMDLIDSQIAINYTKEFEILVNKHINAIFISSYAYLNMAHHFQRDDVALNGFWDFYTKKADGKRDYARTVIKYQTDRGGRVVLENISAPIHYDKPESLTPLQSIKLCLHMEKKAYNALLNLHSKACAYNDPSSSDFFEMALTSQTNLIKEIGDHLTNIKRVGSGLGDNCTRTLSDNKNQMIERKAATTTPSHLIKKLTGDFRDGVHGLPSRPPSLLVSTMSNESANQLRCNYAKELEELINKQIHAELVAFYAYQNIANHFQRDDVALEGFHKFFIKMADEEAGHARMLMKFQNERGGRVILETIHAPSHYQCPESLTPLGAMQKSLEMEKNIYNALIVLHYKTASLKDPSSSVLIEDMMREQVTSIKEFGDYVTNLKRVGSGL
ncbi:hypothetical protein HZS_1692, partial [Henneguya salminicola]